MAKYARPTSAAKLDKPTRQQLLREYSAHYSALAKAAPVSLNVKLPRAALAPLLDEIGGRLVEEAERLSREPGPVRAFLEQNALPAAVQPYLPDSFRAFCLVLNSLKQWTAKEQAAADRYLLGGLARDECRASASTCVITGQVLGKDAELHHPVRDGRPPLYISKQGHDLIEGQTRGDRARAIGTKAPEVLISVGTTGDRRVMDLVLGVKRNESWKQLRRGCLDHLGREADHSTSVAVQRNARAFASRVRKATGLSFEGILAWLDENNLARNSYDGP